MNWFLTIVFLISLVLGASSDASHEKKLQPKAVILGKVYCETCFEGISKSTHFISGASVGVECKDVTSSNSIPFQAQVKTDNQGVFRIQLPFSISKDVTKIHRCSVKLIRSNDANCAVPSSASSSSLHLKPTKQGAAHVFSSGFLTFKLSNHPNTCNQKLNDENKLGLAKPDFFFFPPNPLNPPSLLPPNPIIPSPAPLIPNPFQPPPAPLIPSLPPLPTMPPLPGLTPPPPPPPSLPSLPPLPSLPFPPLPLIPGVPPASPSP